MIFREKKLIFIAIFQTTNHLIAQLCMVKDVIGVRFFSACKNDSFTEK